MSLYINTLVEMKAGLGIDDSVDDAVLTAWLEGLEGRIDMFCRRILLQETSRVEIHNGGETSLFVMAWPLETVSEVVIDGDQDWDNANSVLDSDDYLVNHRRGSILYGRGSSRWPEGALSIRVTYTGGLVAADGTAASSYVESSHLRSLKRAFMMQGEFEWRNRETLGITQISAGGVAKQVGAGVALALKGKTLLPEVEQTLAPLVRIL